MNKIYTVKICRVYLVGHILLSVVIILLLLSQWKIMSPLDFTMIGLLSFYLLFWFGYAITHKIELNFDSREIYQIIFGVKYKTVKIDEIKEYYLSKHDAFFTGEGFLPTGKFDTHLNLRQSSSGKDIMKEFFWNISPEDAEDLFSKAKEMNGNIIWASEKFYHNVLYKPRQSVYLIAIVIILCAGFLFIFLHYLNNTMMNSPF